MGRATPSVDLDVPAIIDQLVAGTDVSRDQIKRILGLTEKSEIQYLFSAAREMRSRFFGKNIFLYGFLYFSTHCRNDCSFCQYRKSNAELDRYRKSEAEILSAAREMAQSGVHLIDLTMGEDPLMLASGASHLKRFGDIVMAVKAETDLPLMISPGVLPGEILTPLAQAGVDWYACYQETHNVSHFNRLRKDQSFDKRLAVKQLAKANGMLVEEGILLGTGESLDDIVDSLYFMKQQGLDQVRAMTFVPQKGVTIDRVGVYDPMQELLTIAVMRLLMPDRLIPGSLDVDGLEGLAARLDAGANVVTSIVPPDNGLAGVVNKSLDIEDARRTMYRIAPVIKACGLEVATQQCYEEWVRNRRCNTTRRCQSLETAECV
jgi:methylornithine synthase